MIDAHHHLWNLEAVRYPWLMDPAPRFFGDPAPIRRNYLLEEFRADVEAAGGTASVHIQVGAEDGLAEARWVQGVAEAAKAAGIAADKKPINKAPANKNNSSFKKMKPLKSYW